MKLDLTKMNGIGCKPISESDMPKGPTIHLEWDKPYKDLPDSGTATVKFKVRRRTHEVEEGSYEVTLELLSFETKGKSKVAATDTETKDALNALRAEKMKEMEGEEEGEY